MFHATPTADITPTFYDYTCPLGLSEATADKALYLPGLSPVAEIGVYVKTKGIGSLYVVVHDKNDNIVAEATAIPAANITAGAYNWFSIAPDPSAAISAGNQASLVPWAGDLSEGGGEYHVHVFSSNTGYVLQTVTDSSLYYGLRMKSRGYVLYETYNGKHPLAVYKSVYIGNGQYVAELQSSPRNYIDDTMYLPHRLRLDDGFEVCSMLHLTNTSLLAQRNIARTAREDSRLVRFISGTANPMAQITASNATWVARIVFTTTQTLPM